MLSDWLRALLIPTLILLHLCVSPYTKVEESFNIQAIHDILTYGIPSSNIPATFRVEYDHFTFPGAVPRTFVGALLIAGIARPLIWLNSSVDRQFLVRAVLGIFNAFALATFARGVSQAFGENTALWYILFQASQFHVIYYASRTIPNMFAFGISTLALRYLLPDPSSPRRSPRSRKRSRLALYLLTVTGIVFRSEIALFLVTHTIYLWVKGHISLRREIVPAGAAGLLIGLLLTVPIDSFFWQHFPLWPELAAFKFNVVSGHTSAWGTQPWHFYFTDSLPRLLLNPLTYFMGLPIACLLSPIRPAAVTLVFPSLAYIAIYSLQPHKEWRFIIYTIPPLATASALGASYIWARRTKSLTYKLLSASLIISILASLAMSTFLLLPASMANYPGAEALNALQASAHGSKQIISVHMDQLACQTGITRFLELPPPKSMLVFPGSNETSFPTLRSEMSVWVYDKTEDEVAKRSAAFWDRFDYALLEDPSQVGGSGEWEVVKVVEGFDGVVWLRPGDATSKHAPEGEIVKRILGDGGIRMWEIGREMVRKYLTAGWWMEIKMAPKISILKHIR